MALGMLVVLLMCGVLQTLANFFDFGNEVSVAATYGWAPAPFQGLADQVWLIALFVRPCQVHVDSRVFWIDAHCLLKVGKGFGILPRTKKLISQAEEEHGIVRLLLQQLFQRFNAVFAHPLGSFPATWPPVRGVTLYARLTPGTSRS